MSQTSCCEDSSMTFSEAPPSPPSPPSPSKHLATSDNNLRWFDILSQAQLPTQLSTDTDSRVPSPVSEGGRALLLNILSSAIVSSRKDSLWSDSGIPELLVRARLLAQQGCSSARLMALSLLDFHKMVERYRAVAPSMLNKHSGKRGRQDVTTAAAAAGGRQEFIAPQDGAVCFVKRRCPGGGDGGGDSCCSNDSSSTNSGGSVFAVPDRPRPMPASSGGLVAAERPLHSGSGTTSRRALTPPPPPPPSPPLVAPTPAATEAPTSVWSGPLRHRQRDGVGAGVAEDLAFLEILLPAAAALSPQLPAALYVSHLVPRSAVRKLGSHHACRTSCQRASPAQLAALRDLAARELVAVVPLAPASSHGAPAGTVVAAGAAGAAAGVGRGGSASAIGGALVLVPYFDNTRTLCCVSFLLGRVPHLAARP